jgi:hypothetical protein
VFQHSLLFHLFPPAGTILVEMNQSVANWRLGQLDVSVGEDPARKGSGARLRRQAGYMSELSGIIRPLVVIHDTMAGICRCELRDSLAC